MLRPMETRKTIPGRWTFDRGLTRALLAYLVIVTLGVWVFYVVQDTTQGRNLVDAVAAATTFLRNSVVLLPFLSILLLPAMVLTLDLVHRFKADTIAARLVVGAASWAGWGLFSAIILVVASRLVVVLEVLASDLVFLAASGAVYSLLAFDGYETRPGKAMVALALAATVLVILGSMWMAGRWGGTA